MTGDTVVVDTPAGPVAGRRRGRVDEFLGLPYATAERFGLPRAVAPWTAVRDATRHGPISPQLPSRLGPVCGLPDHRGLVADEDCLNLVVRAPAGSAPGDGRPVVVWFHGGAYIGGAGALPWYDTTRWVDEGDVVTVSVTYRLGILGWLHRPGVAPGNLGLHDLLAALTWVRDHVAAFGGDPDRVTVVGQSAGAHATACLLSVPGARPLIRRAVLQSGQFGLAPLSVARAARVAGFVDEALAGDPHTVPTEALLEAQRVAMVRSAGPGGANSAPAFAPVAGVAPLAPGVDTWAAAAAGGHDLVVGATADEARTFVRISPGLEQVRRVPVVGGPVVALGAAVATRRVFTAPAARIADDAARAGASVWTYSFDHRPTRDLGACHCVELPFLFDRPDAWAAAPMLAGASWAEDVAPLGARMRAAWLGFARDGDPGAGWPRHVPGGGPGARFGGRSPDTGTLEHATRFPRALRRTPLMPLVRRLATVGAAVAAARSYARQNPEKVNRYADKAAEFVNQRTNGKYRKHVDTALRQIRKETSVPGRPTINTERAPGPTTPNQRAAGQAYYPSSRADR